VSPAYPLPTALKKAYRMSPNNWLSDDWLNASTSLFRPGNSPVIVLDWLFTTMSSAIP